MEAAKKKAQAEHKLLGFIMVWDMFFQPAQPMGTHGPNALAGFYTVFNNALVLVFVRHEDELGKVPAAVGQGFSGPDEGGWAPNMAVVTADCSQFVCEIPLGGEHSNGAIREPIFRAKIAEIKKFLESPKALAPAPVPQTNTESATVEPAKAETNEGASFPASGSRAFAKSPGNAAALRRHRHWGVGPPGRRAAGLPPEGGLSGDNGVKPQVDTDGQRYPRITRIAANCE